MEGENRIEIVDKENWRKEFLIQKRLIFIGSDPRNDIVLNPMRGAGVAPRHIQIIATADPSSSSGQRSIVNLSAQPIPIGENSNRSLEPATAMTIAEGEMLRLGEFTLVFHLAYNEEPGATFVPAGTARAGRAPSDERLRPPSAPTTAASIGLRVSLSQPFLSPEAPVEGMIYVTNQGTVPGVQFILGIEGLPPECCEVGPAPILFPGAEKGVPLRISHPCRPGFPAGALRLVFSAQATEAYPGEKAVVSRDIRLLPYFQHTLRLIMAD